MEIKLTQEQAIQIATNAVNASSPMGLGFLHAEKKDYTVDEVFEGFPHFDYFHGRIVKLTFREKDGVYIFPDHEPRTDYQSWASKYPTYEDLVNSVLNETAVAPGMTRQEHLQWCKDRALEYVDQGDMSNALASMASDLGKHAETEDAAELVASLGMPLMLIGKFDSTQEGRDFINGFN